VDSCCKPEDLETLRTEQRWVLSVVLGINLSLFVLELTAGFLVRSTALLGDSLDMLGDSLVYGFSLYVLAGSDRQRTYAAALKGLIMLSFGVFVFAEAAAKVFLDPVVPTAEAMGMVGLLALCGNALCFWLLYRHRGDDVNMRSTWLCSRNDLIANISVLAAAVAVAATNTIWPDVIVGTTIAALFLRTGFDVLRDSLGGLSQQQRYSSN
jgi:cation diffusion facilitator family transporter